MELLDVEDTDLKEHRDIIQKLCRICGEKINLRKGYLNAKSVNDKELKETIFRAYNIDSISESCNVHPKKLCSKCVHRVHTLKTKFNKGNLDIMEFFESHFFMPHHPDCEYCSKVEKHSLKLKDLDAVMNNFGYEKVIAINTPVNVLRNFCLNEFINEYFVTKIRFVLFKDFSWKCYVYGLEASIHEMPNKFSSDDDLKLLISFLEVHDVCHGIGQFQDVIAHRLDLNPIFKDATIETSNMHQRIGQKEDYEFVRPKTCTFFKLKSKKTCEACQSYTKKIYVMRSRIGTKRSSTEADSHTNYRWLSHEEKNERMANIQAEKRNLARKLARWSTRIKEQIQTNGVSISDKEHDTFLDVLNKNDPKFDCETPQWLLWEQQKLAASKKDSRGMRWHPLILR